MHSYNTNKIIILTAKIQNNIGKLRQFIRQIIIFHHPNRFFPRIYL